MADVTRQDIEDEFSDGDREPSVNIYANSSSTVYIRLPINSNVSAASFDINRWEYSTADNMTISIGNSSIFNASISAGTITIPVSNFSDVLNDYIETCMQSAGMCEIPLVFYSSSDSELFLDDLIVEYSYTTNEPVGDPMDIDGHGTHVAGIVHAVAPNAELYAYQVFTSGGVYESDVIKGITIAIRDKVDVISMSLGGGRYYGHCDEDPIVQAGQAALNEKISVVVATGNDGYSNSIASPSCGSGFISVGAINSNKEIASFSNGGSLLDVVSYGVGINSTVPLGIASSGYDAWDGTSMATPFVSGLVALYRQAYNLTYNETALAEHVSYIIGDTSDDLGVYGKDDVFGYGIPNITRMIDSLGYKTAISPEEQVIIFDAVEPGIHSKKLILTQQGIEQEFDILVNWTSLTNGNDEIMMMIDDEIDEFNESITDRLVLSIEANVIDDISAGRYNGEIKINVLQNDREIVIPVQLEVPLNVTSGNLFFQGNISEGETVKYPLNVSDSITAITVNITWVFETSDIDISLYSPGGDALIITSRDLKSEMDDDIRKSSDYERNVIFGKRR